MDALSRAGTLGAAPDAPANTPANTPPDTPPAAGPGMLQALPGRGAPLGLHWDGQGLNIAVYAGHAHSVTLCLFDHPQQRERHRLRLPGRSQDIHHGWISAAALAAAGYRGDADGGPPALLYGLRADGPWRPDRGQRHNPRKLLLDPWARQIVGSLDDGPEHWAHDQAYPLQPDPRDNAASALKCRLLPEGRWDRYDWGDDAPPRVPLAHTVIYEAHVKGLTRLHPALPPALRGTFAGLAQPAVVDHLRALGITAVSLLPVMQRLSEPRLRALGLSNYWGYNTLGFFCAEPTLAAQPERARDEFRDMVKALHAAGIEVLLDVVYNHSAEGDADGPCLSWRGLDNAGWYRLPPGDLAHYENPSGCGNAFDLRRPQVLRFVLDSLRWWVTQMHVDGFRFDLAPVLARGDHGFERDGPFFRAVAQDPVLAPLWADGKLIAEPWDIGPGGWQSGNFPQGWLEWNDGFRDTMRAFWLGGATDRGQFAQRLAGSSDRLQARRRLPGESVNYIVSHDGYTLRDLVSYDLRHNHANGEHNRDGHAHNLSWNCGHEGETDDPEVLALRRRLQRALLATLLLAQGTPMLAAGDELGHTQHGNNNPYCQDNPTTWIAWAQADASLLAWTRRLLQLRRRWLPLGTRWYSGTADARGLPDLGWLRRNGRSLNADDWRQSNSRVLGVLIGQPGLDGHGRPPQAPCGPLLLWFNAEPHDVDCQLPPSARADRGWLLLLDSSQPQTEPAPAAAGRGASQAGQTDLAAPTSPTSPAYAAPTAPAADHAVPAAPLAVFHGQVRVPARSVLVLLGQAEDAVGPQAAPGTPGGRAAPGPSDAPAARPPHPRH